VIVVAIVLGTTIAAAVGCLVWLSARLARAERAAAFAHADLLIARASLATQTDRADAETRRADALDELLESLPAGDAAGARARVLAAYARARGDGPRPVPAQPSPAAVERVDRDGLLRPGED